MQVLAARPLADSAVTLDLAETIGPEAAARVATADALLGEALARGELPGATEITRSFVSLTVHYDPLAGGQAELLERIEALLADAQVAEPKAGRFWRLPCCYDPEFGLDLAELEERLGLPQDEIIRQHAGAEMHVYALGFLPGLPFLGQLPDSLALPRRSSPRSRLPAGSVAIANGLSVIYPWESPGGWHLVGRCPVPLFDAHAESPTLLGAGDSVRFTAISRAEFDAVAAEAAAGTLDAQRYAEEPAA